MPPPYGFAPPGYIPLPPPISPAGAPLADWGTRFAAYLIDSILLGVVGLLVGIPAFFLMGHWIAAQANSSFDASDDNPGWVFSHVFGPFLALEFGIFAFTLLVSYLYFVEATLRRNGQTLAKKWLKIQVVPIDPRQTLGRGMLARRWAAFVLAGSFVPFWNLIDGLWPLWDKPFLQALHDKAGQTVVVKVSA